MGSSYHQFCPVAKAMELLDERWTLLLVRELVLGSMRFNDLRRGLPRMSPALLSTRLHTLTAAGVVEKREVGNEVHYTLTDAGRELRPVVEALGMWGTRWIGTLGDQDLDPKLLMWDMHRNVNRSALPAGRTVVRFRFTERAPRAADAPLPARWWLVMEEHAVDVCDVDPGFEVTVAVESTLRTLTEIWRGDITWSTARRRGDIDISGPEQLRRDFLGWFSLPPFAGVPRPHDTEARHGDGGSVATRTR